MQYCPSKRAAKRSARASLPPSMAPSTLSDFALTLYHAPLSRSARATWAIHELGVRDVTIRRVNIFLGEQYYPSYRSLSKMSRVPLLHLRHKPTGAELAMTESLAIVLFLCEKAGSLLPREADDPLARARFHRLCALAVSSVDPLLETIGMHARSSRARVRGMRAPSAGDDAFARREFARKVVPTLEDAVGNGGRWLCGEFSAADVIVGYALFWASLYGLVDGSERLRRYLERVMDRPAFQAGVGTVDEIRARLKKAGGASGIEEGRWLLSKM